MKKLIIIILALNLIGCFKKEPEVNFPFPDKKFGTRVSIIGGFYEGQMGTIVDYTMNYSTECSKGYRVKFDSTLIEKPEFICHGSLIIIK